ncbi:MAG: hypothetical protein NVS9B9_08050 [Ktedonobacteraceae bacterium]
MVGAGGKPELLCVAVTFNIDGVGVVGNVLAPGGTPAALVLVGLAIVVGVLHGNIACIPSRIIVVLSTFDSIINAPVGGSVGVLVGSGTMSVAVGVGATGVSVGVGATGVSVGVGTMGVSVGVRRITVVVSDSEMSAFVRRAAML